MNEAGMNGVYSQIELARSEEVQSYLISALKENVKLLSRISNFHKKFIKTAIDHNTMKNLLWWRKIYHSGEEQYNIYFASYYRKDCYLLSDCPYLFKPVVAILHPNMPEHYYGVDKDGVNLLVKNDAVWLEALHPKKYSLHSKGKDFIEELSEGKYLPYYSDTFEDALATYWIKNVMIDGSIDLELKRGLKDYVNNTRMEMDEFIKMYYKYINKTKENFGEIIRNIPKEAVNHRNASLRYNDLQEIYIERLLKVNLIQDCISHIRDQKEVENKNILIDFNKTLAEIKLLLNISNSTDRRYALADFIFKLWQQRGAPWFYSMGNVVDFSGRDLCLTQCGPVDPPQNELSSINFPGLSKFINIVDATDVDSVENVNKYSAERKELLNNFFKDMAVNDPYYLDHVFEIHKISYIENTTEISDKIREYLSKIITPAEQKDCMGRIKELSFPHVVEVIISSMGYPNVGKIVGKATDVWYAISKKEKVNICKYGLRPLSSFDGKKWPISEYHSIEDINKKFNPDISDEFSYDMHALQLPYIRSLSKYHSGRMIYGFGSD